MSRARRETPTSCVGACRRLARRRRGTPSAPRPLALLALGPGRVDVIGEPFAGELAVASRECLVDPAMRRHRPGERSARCPGRQERRDAPVPMDRSHDRQADLVAGTPSSRSRGSRGRVHGSARSRRTSASIRSRLSASAASSSSVSRVAAAHAISRSSTRRTAIRLSSSDMSWSYSSAIWSTTGSSRFQRVARLDRRAAPLLDPDEPTLLEELQRLTDHRATEAELRAQGRLVG